jgi:hypothetical protein
VTAVLALINERQAIQLSDRRLLYRDGRQPDEESDKAMVLITGDARLAVGFTGLAKARRFDTHKWVQDTLIEVREPDFAAAPMVSRFEAALTERFAKPDLAGLGADRRLTVVLSGYLYRSDPPQGWLAMVSNYDDLETGIESADARDRFQTWLTVETRPRAGPATILCCIGASRAMTDQDESGLQELLAGDKPAKGILGKAVEVVHGIADRSKGTVGKQLSSVVIPREQEKPALLDYHSETVGHEVRLPAMVVAHPEMTLAMRDGAFGADDPATTPPLVGPKIGRNQQCWCGSGKKYKKCHGR